MLKYWKWTIYPKNLSEGILYNYLSGADKTKKLIIEVLEIFYLPYALQKSNASSLEIQKAFQRSIDLLQSRIRIMSLDAGEMISISADLFLQPLTDKIQTPVPIEVDPILPSISSSSPMFERQTQALTNSTITEFSDDDDDDDDDMDWDAPVIRNPELDNMGLD
jgi:hypothetical protein